MEEKDLQLHEQASLHLWNATKWMKFMAIMMIIGAVFLVVGAFAMLAVGSVAKDVTNYPAPNPVNFPFWVVSVLYFAMAALYVVPIVYLLRASKAGKAAAEDNNNEEVVAFLKYNQSFWKFVGILTIVMLGLGIVMLPVIAIVAL